MIARARAGGDQRPRARRARDPAHAAALRGGDARVGQSRTRGESAADLERPHDLGAVVVGDLLENARVEVGQRLHQLVAFAVVAQAADLAVDQSIGSGRIVVRASLDEDGLALVASRRAIRGARGDLLEDGLEPVARPTGLERVVRVLEERVTVTEDDAPAALGAQLLP